MSLTPPGQVKLQAGVLSQINTLVTEQLPAGQSSRLLTQLGCLLRRLAEYT